MNMDDLDFGHEFSALYKEELSEKSETGVHYSAESERYQLEEIIASSPRARPLDRGRRAQRLCAHSAGSALAQRSREAQHRPRQGQETTRQARRRQRPRLAAAEGTNSKALVNKQ